MAKNSNGANLGFGAKEMAIRMFISSVQKDFERERLVRFSLFYVLKETGWVA